MSELLPVRRNGAPPATRTRLHGNSNLAKEKLKMLGFDPLTEMIMVYNKLDDEIKRQEDIRDGKVVEIGSTGKAKAYRPEVHHALFDKQILISEKLLRYAYGRVPEGDTDRKAMLAPLIVNLTKEGDTYVINQDAMPDSPNPMGITLSDDNEGKYDEDDSRFDD